MKSRLNRGQKLLFKPNLVNPFCIETGTFAPGMRSTACTEWPFIAALMRWFHDDLDVSYYRMCIGEAATLLPVVPKIFTHFNPDKKTITPEAVIEGRSGNFYGGWGFFFARKYLAESMEPGGAENPMNGYEESADGAYLAPGLVKDRLMVYDLNRISDDPSKGRSIPVPGGVNFTSITLHKAIVGGSPDDPGDRAAYPGSILVNVPKFKVHAIALFTNVIKNLGIGLYPMQHASSGGSRWDYSNPQGSVPGMKGMLPHNVWTSYINEKTFLPDRDEAGNAIVRKTGGITATMIDIIRAVQSQDIFMIHVVDGVEAINLDHQGILPGVKEPEGMVFAGLDPVAVDLLCARYMFSNVPIKDALQQPLEDGNGGRFPQEGTCAGRGRDLDRYTYGLRFTPQPRHLFQERGTEGTGQQAILCGRHGRGDRRPDRDDTGAPGDRFRKRVHGPGHLQGLLQRVQDALGSAENELELFFGSRLACRINA